MIYEVATRIIANYVARVDADSADEAERMVASLEEQWPNLADWEIEHSEVWVLDSPRARP